MSKVGKIFASVAMTILSHVAGAETGHLVQALKDAEQVASLGSGQSAPYQIATVTEQGNKYEIWLTVRRQ
jgi:hypothetical protein